MYFPFRFEVTSVILDSPFHHRDSISKQSPPSIHMNQLPQAAPSEGLNGHDRGSVGASPYPLIDQFVTSILVKDGLTGKIRESTFFSQGIVNILYLKHNTNVPSNSL